MSRSELFLGVIAVATLVMALIQVGALVAILRLVRMTQQTIADVVVVMHMGALLAKGTIGDIEANARVREVYLGEMEHA